MAVRLRKLLTAWVSGEPLNEADLNDTFEAVSRFRSLREVINPTTVTLDDDVLLLKPNNSSNTFTQITSGEYTYGGKNFVRSGNMAYMSSTSGGGGTSNGLSKLNLTTGTITVAAIPGFSSNGTTCHATDGTYLYYSNYSNLIQRINISTGVITTFATCPANVYALTRDEVTGNFYAQAYGGTIYKITTSGVVTTHFTSALWASVVCAMTVDILGIIYISAGATSYKISQSGIATQLATFLNNAPYYYNSSDNSIYYKKDVIGYKYFAKYDIATETETLLTKANGGSDLAILTDGTNYYQGDSGAINSVYKVLISSAINVLNVFLPAPSNANKGKEVTMTCPYSFTGGNSPFVVGKIISDYGNNTQISNIGFVYNSPYGTGHRTLRFLSDAVNWILIRN